MLLFSRKFGKHASVIIDMCFDENNEFALDILTKKSSLFFSKDPLEIAKDIDSRTFLATKTVQRYLDQQWYGHLNGYDQNLFWISSLVRLIFFILRYFLFFTDLYYVLYTHLNSYPSSFKIDYIR
jgi:hypothetical protein